MSTQVEVTAQFEATFELPEGIGALDLVNSRSFKEPNKYTLVVQVRGESVEEARKAVETLRRKLIYALQDGTL